MPRPSLIDNIRKQNTERQRARPSAAAGCGSVEMSSNRRTAQQAPEGTASVHPERLSPRNDAGTSARSATRARRPYCQQTRSIRCLFSACAPSLPDDCQLICFDGHSVATESAISASINQKSRNPALHGGLSLLRRHPEARAVRYSISSAVAQQHAAHVRVACQTQQNAADPMMPSGLRTRRTTYSSTSSSITEYIRHITVYSHTMK